MADLEVEQTLAEIRERVRIEARVRSHANGMAVTQPGSGQSNLPSTTPPARPPNESLQKLAGDLAGAERAWNKLPPLVSYRSDFMARIELWIKRQIKRASYWYVWEQINFNASIRESLRDVQTILASQAQYQAILASQSQDLDQIRGEIEKLRADSDLRYSDLEKRLHGINARLASGDQARESIERQIGAAAASREELLNRLNQLERDQAERTTQLLDEHRVCFRQLSLESDETFVMFDSARRSMEQKLNEILARLEERGSAQEKTDDGSG